MPQRAMLRAAASIEDTVVKTENSPGQARLNAIENV